MEELNTSASSGAAVYRKEGGKSVPRSGTLLNTWGWQRSPPYAHKFTMYEYEGAYVQTVLATHQISIIQRVYQILSSVGSSLSTLITNPRLLRPLNG